MILFAKQNRANKKIYSKRGGYNKIKGRSSVLSDQIHNKNMSWKILLPVAILIFLAVILVLSQKMPAPKESNQQLPEITIPVGGEEQPIASLPATTDNIDDYISALIQNSSDEQTSVNESMSNDFDLIDLDDQAISDFGQSYGESEF